MTSIPDDDLRARYADLLEEEDGDALRVVRLLDAGYRAVQPPPAQPPLLAGPRSSSTVERPGRWPWRRSFALLAALAILTVMGGAAVAVTNLTNLGRPTNTLPAAPAPATGNFHRINVTLQQQGKPELLFLGTQVDGNSAAEAWPVVKALQQFGTLSNVTPLLTQPCSMVTGTLSCTVPPRDAVPGFQAGDATFNLDQARYSSRYLVFVYRDLIGRNLRVQQLPPSERSLFDRYARASGYAKWNDAVWHTAVGYPSPGQSDQERQFPLVAVGRYLEAGPTLALQGDLLSNVMLPLPFATIQQSLQRDRAVAKATQTLAPDFNAETNVLTALICHADGKRPGSVCSRPAIKDILKHVK